jgi:hypothetical protein
VNLFESTEGHPNSSELKSLLGLRVHRAWMDSTQEELFIVLEPKTRSPRPVVRIWAQADPKAFLVETGREHDGCDKWDDLPQTPYTLSLPGRPSPTSSRTS